MTTGGDRRSELRAASDLRRIDAGGCVRRDTVTGRIPRYR